MTTDALLVSILAREGWPAVTNRPSDAGGLTKGGVTFAQYNAWLRQQGHATITPEVFVTITEDQAKAFMLSDIAGPLLPVQAIDEPLFDLLVDWAETSGPEPPTRSLQTVLRDEGTTLAIDGEYGATTQAALVLAVSRPDAAASLVRAVAKARVEFYVALTLADQAVRLFRVQTPTTALENIQGWTARALEFL